MPSSISSTNARNAEIGNGNASELEGTAHEPRTTPRGDLLARLANIVQVTDIEPSRRIFVNRNLRMDEIDIVGFDMDYTLAIYNQRHIEALSMECTLEKLVQKRNYPEAILKLDYDPNFAIRGLVIDRRYGNVFKMDRYGHVGRVYHGRRLLSKEERRELYRGERIRLSSSRYAWIDTLFALPEAVMFARILDFLEERHGLGHRKVRYSKLWQDIRDSIDEAHRDESMKRVIKGHLGDYVERDPQLAAALHKFRSSGKRLFLLTNSFWDYTDKVMSWLLDGQLAAYPSWRNFFDLVVVGAAKPAFFTEKRPFVEIDAQGNEKGPAQIPLARGRIYQGGNVAEIEQQFQTRGDRILYIGDHIYGDMLRAKKASVWRTAMIVQELEQELDIAAKMAGKTYQIEDLERKRRRLDAELNYEQLVQKSLQRIAPGQLPTPRGGTVRPPLDESTLEAARLEVRHRIDELRATLRNVVQEIASLEQEVNHAFNPFWGPLFKVGVENSRFGEQVEDYACVYTSRVSNFLSYSPLQYFRSPRDHMPHEL